MGIFRSEEMQLFSLILQADEAWRVLNDLGKLDKVQFMDINKDKMAHEMKYAKTVKKIEEIHKQIEMIERECDRLKIEMNAPQSLQDLQQQIDKLRDGKSEQHLQEEIEREMHDKEKFILDQMKQIKDLHAHYNTLLDDQENDGEFREDQNLIGEESHSHFNPLMGTISQEEQLRFKKLIFRASRGMAHASFYEMKERMFDYYGNQINKVVYVIFFPLNFEYLRNKLMRICDSFQGERLQLPKGSDQIRENFLKNKHSLDNAFQSLTFTVDNFRKILEDIHHNKKTEGYSIVQIYKMYLTKTKLVYVNLNRMKPKGQLLLSLVWIPKKFVNQVQELLNDEETRRGIQFQQVTNFQIQPPTHFEINEFVYPFHEVVVTYGVPSYQEVNPTAFNIVTFPFLFGIMFGDIGHGFLLFLFAAYLCFKKDDLFKNKDLIGFLKGRYLLLLMGFFATYCGLIYNDMMAMPLNLFGSCYQEGEEGKSISQMENCVYPFGIDPKWYVSKNELNFLNSLKMKLAVLYGVVQMTLGVFCKGLNNIYFCQGIDFIFEFIPQLVFLLCLFGYMDLMIILKWLNDYTNKENDAPSIITQMINNSLHGGEVDKSPLVGDKDYQQHLSILLGQICLLCVPLMLFVKPLYLNAKYKRQAAQRAKLSSKRGQSQKSLNADEEDRDSHRLLSSKSNEVPDENWYIPYTIDNTHAKEHQFGELFIHQMIETIEFVLGCISNTASYLRLWALSLAHSQLAKVFFEKTIGSALEANSIILVRYNYLIALQMTVSFFVFASVTFFVLMFMDVLECFLHDLRLHWVEFQNKFYKGLGYKFVAFSHENEIFPHKLNI